MRALIYGHSQSGGMGLDLERALRSRGFTVVRDTRIGANDRALISGLSTAPPGPWDRVYLYGGGNSDAPSVADLRTLVAHFGAGRTVLILPPTNTGDPSRLSMMRAKNRANATALSPFVPVYAIEAPAAEFAADQIHMRPGAPSSVALAGRIVAETGQPGALTPHGPDWRVVGLLAAAAAILAASVYVSRR